MLISKRRWRWTAIALLLVCVVLLLRPTRIWLEQAWITRAISPQISVGEFVFHSQKSIVEARDVKWRIASSETNLPAQTGIDGRTYGVSVRRGWFGIDVASLPRGDVRLSKVILQDADLYLESGLPNSHSGFDSWRQQLSRHVVGFDWGHLRSRFACLAATEGVRLDWSGRIEGWLKRSEQVRAVVSQIEGETEAMDNPLRFEESLREKLSRLQQLADEQRAMLVQLDELQGALASESERLIQLHQQDLKTFAEISTQAKGGPVNNLGGNTLERELAETLGGAVWSRLAPYGEIVDKLGRAAANLRASNYDVTVRSNEHWGEQNQASEMKASGMFLAGHSKSPYHTQGTWRRAQQTPGQAYREFDFVTDFRCDSTNINIASQYDSRQDTKIELEIVVSPSRNGAGDSPISSDSANATAEQQRATLAEIISDAGKLSGELSVEPWTLSLLTGKLPQELLDSTRAISCSPLRFEVGGVWDEPNLKLNGEVPDWLRRAVEKATIEQSQGRLAEVRAKLDSEFGNQLLQLRQVADIAVRDAKFAMSTDESQLLTSQERLQQRLDAMCGTEFARRQIELQR